MPFLTVSAVLVLGSLAWRSLGGLGGGAPASSKISVPVQRGRLSITVTAGGELQSGQAAEMNCDVEGETKVVEMLPEGTVVSEGQIVMRLDPSNVNDRLAQQEIKVAQAEAFAKAAGEELTIQENLGASAIAEAELALTLARLDKTKYIEGDYNVELNDLKGSIALAEADLEEAEDAVEFYTDLVKKGFRTPEQLEAKIQTVKRARFTLTRDQEKLSVLEKFTRERQVAELNAKAEEAERELTRARSSAASTIVKARTDWEVAEATARLERKQLEKLKQQLAACEVRAPCGGTLVYANDNKNRMELGQTVHFKQPLFRIPDLEQMQVQAFVHESVVKKVQPGMEADVRVEAIPDRVFRGSVLSVSNFYDSTRHWLSGGVKEYAATLAIESTSSAELKPGMTAEATIHIRELSDVLSVPIPSVAVLDGQSFCYVQVNGKAERREVSLGLSDENVVQVTTGLTAGERVLLNAHAFAAEDRRDARAAEAGDNRGDENGDSETPPPPRAVR